jgi:hypothetical protein
MKVHGLLLDRNSGGAERRHDGRIAVDERNRRWCSDGFEIGCDNGEKVRVAFALDCCDRRTHDLLLQLFSSLLSGADHPQSTSIRPAFSRWRRDMPWTWSCNYL